MTAALVLVLLLGGAAAAQEPPPASPRWTKQASSLLLYDSSGTLVSEVALPSEEESSGGRSALLETLGGTSPNGRFAWSYETTTAWNPAKTRVLESRRLFRLYGSGGKALWESSEVEAPESGVPAAFSSDGETLLLVLKSGGERRAAVKSFTGVTLCEAGPFARVKALTLSPLGRYGLARWDVPEKSATHTFLRVSPCARRDVPSENFLTGPARIDEDGRVYAGKRRLFDFARVPSPGPKP